MVPLSLARYVVAARALAFLGACSKTPTPTPPPPATASLPEAPGAGDLTVGRPPPAFSFVAHDGTRIDSAALLGKRPVVLYFYPKDETPGCTKEACAFRDAWNNLAKTDVALVGISGDNQSSHKAFAEHHKLPFQLVTDERGDIAKSFGVPFTMGFAGRQSIVIGKDGLVKKIYRSVDVTTHAAEVTADLAAK